MRQAEGGCWLARCTCLAPAEVRRGLIELMGGTLAVGGHKGDYERLAARTYDIGHGVRLGDLGGLGHAEHLHRADENLEQRSGLRCLGGLDHQAFLHDQQGAEV